MVFKALPLVYFITMNYELSRGLRPSAIALAGLCHAIQDEMGKCDPFPFGFPDGQAQLMRNNVLEGVTKLLSTS